MSDDEFDEMKLPMASSTEELETISTNKFKPKFDATKFDFGQYLAKDKGVDFNVEIKHNKRHTNFKFHIQLKATEKIKRNKDRTISLKIYTANINYLLDSGWPAYYVLYFKAEDKFFYANINDFVKSLVKKSSDWQDQDSHILRFKDELTDKAIENIYTNTLSFGKFKRKLTEKLAIESSFISQEDKVTIDENLNVSGDAQIRRLIEGMGLILINEARWNEILIVHQRASQTVATSAKYNLILGVAYYHSGELAQSLSHLRKAQMMKQELSKGLQEYLQLFNLIVDAALSRISGSKFDDEVAKLEMHKDLKYQVRIAKAQKNFTKAGQDNFQERIDTFLKELDSIIDDPKAPDTIKAMARGVRVLPAGKAIHEAYTSSAPKIKAMEAMMGPNPEVRKAVLRHVLSIQIDWALKVKKLKDDLLDSKKYFEFFLVIIDEAKILYELDGYIDHFNYDPEELKKLATERRQATTKMLENVKRAVGHYRQIGHIENLTAALDLQYQMQTYLGENQQAKATLEELTDVVNAHDLKDHKRKLEVLKNEGPFHKRLATLMSKLHQQGRDKQAEYDRLVKEMKEMDKEELKAKAKYDSQIQLHPIGFFQFPQTKRNVVYDILRLTPKARAQFDAMYEAKAIPIANIYNDPVPEEGYGDNVMATNNIEAWRNIHRIRKLLFENGFTRIKVR